MMAHRLRTIYTREHRRLPRRGLGRAVNTETRIDGLTVLYDKPIQRRAHLGVYGIIRRRFAYAYAIDE